MGKIDNKALVKQQRVFWCTIIAMRKRFNVSTKAALFNHDKTKVVVIHMDGNDEYGLPGGHVDEDETIEAALRRELAEECGVTDVALNKSDFFMHSNGKIILAFVGRLAGRRELVSQQNEQEGIPRWVTKDEFERLSIEPSYRAFVLSNWV